jgi:DNA-binding IclR family transcriptional regulator
VGTKSEQAGKAPKPQSSSQFVSKVSALLEALATTEEMNATEIAAVLDEPRSSVYRILRNLAEVGWVDQGQTPGHWRIGLHLFRLSSTAVARLDERRAARPHLERLHKLTEQTAFLCIRDGDDAVCIDRIEGLRVASLALRLGGSLPLHVGAAPLTLLAFSEPYVVEMWRKHVEEGKLDRFTEATTVSVDNVMARLEEIRAQGYAISDGDVTPGIAAIGAPVFDHSGALRASVSVSGLRSFILGDDAEVNGTSALKATLEAARAVSHSLGHQD